MKILYIHQNYSKSYTCLGETFLRELKKNSALKVFAFKFLKISTNKYLNKILELTFINKIYFNVQNKNILNRIKIEKPDLVFIFKGTNVNAETLLAIKSLDFKIKIATFNPDDPYNIQSCGANIRNAISSNDYYFIWSKELVKKIKEEGVHKTFYIPFATDPELIKFSASPKLSYDITFIGNVDTERIEWITKIAEVIKINKLKISLDVFGAGWREIEGVKMHSQVNGQEYFDVIRASKCNLNILRLQNKNATNMRTFEVPSCGGIMYHEESIEATLFFKKEDPVFFFKSEDDLIKKYLVNNDHIHMLKEKTEELSERFKKSPNTYADRISNMIRLLEEK